MLDAAEELLGLEGPSFSTEKVAKLAGVGVGTVFRHFPTKEDLLRSVIKARVHRLTGRARQLNLDDAGEALFEFFETIVDHTATTPVILHALRALGLDADDVLVEARAEFMSALDELVQRAQARELMRRDVDVFNVFDLLVAVVHAAEIRGRDPRAAKTALTVVLDGLRAPK